MTDAVNIRPADPDRDAAACAAIYAPFVEKTAASFEERPPSQADFAQRILTITQTHPWLVAENQHKVTGYAYGCPHRERAAYRWAAEVTVYVDPETHRQGVGRALYTELFELLKEQGIYVLCAGITLPNDASVALHESLGFTPVGIYEKIGFKLGKWHDVGWWQLALRPQEQAPPQEPSRPEERSLTRPLSA